MFFFLHYRYLSFVFEESMSLLCSWETDKLKQYIDVIQLQRIGSYIFIVVSSPSKWPGRDILQNIYTLLLNSVLNACCVPSNHLHCYWTWLQSLAGFLCLFPPSRYVSIEEIHIAAKPQKVSIRLPQTLINNLCWTWRVFFPLLPLPVIDTR